MLGIVLGMMVGGIIGVFTLAILVGASRAEECERCRRRQAGER